MAQYFLLVDIVMKCNMNIEEVEIVSLVFFHWRKIWLEPPSVCSTQSSIKTLIINKPHVHYHSNKHLFEHHMCIVNIENEAQIKAKLIINVWHLSQ